MRVYPAPSRAVRALLSCRGRKHWTLCDVCDAAGPNVARDGREARREGAPNGSAPHAHANASTSSPRAPLRRALAPTRGAHRAARRLGGARRAQWRGGVRNLLLPRRGRGRGKGRERQPGARARQAGGLARAVPRAPRLRARVRARRHHAGPVRGLYHTWRLRTRRRRRARRGGRGAGSECGAARARSWPRQASAERARVRALSQGFDESSARICEGD